jgi:hypothetical protein
MTSGLKTGMYKGSENGYKARVTLGTHPTYIHSFIHSSIYETPYYSLKACSSGSDSKN